MDTDIDIFMPPQPMPYAATEALCLAMSVAASVTWHRISFTSHEYWPGIDEICGMYNHYHQHVKWLHFRRNWNRHKGAQKIRKFDTKFESTPIGVAAVSNRCWRL